MRIELLATALVIAWVAPAAADVADAPPWNISGSSKCVQNCIAVEANATRVIQNGKQFRFLNEVGSTGVGEWQGGFFIAYLGCDNVAEISADLQTITFGFGPVWKR